MPIRVVTPSLDSPVAIATALRHLRVLTNDADLVNLYLLVATEAVEDYTGRALLTKTYCLELDSWPDDSADAFIELARSPLISIDSVSYYAPSASILTVWPSTNYRADIATLPGRLELVDGVDLPDVDTRHDAIQIQFKAGYGTLESLIDPTLRMAVLELAQQCYDNRIPVTDVKTALMPYSLRHFLRSKKI